MSIADQTRAWRDEEFRSSLTIADMLMMERHPCGVVELNDADFKNTGECSITFPCSAFNSVQYMCCP